MTLAIISLMIFAALPLLGSSLVSGESGAANGDSKMQCEYYSSECVEKAEREGLAAIPSSCHGVEDCSGEKNICFVVWNNRTGSTLHKDGRHNVKLMGCFEADDSCSDQQACLEDDPGPKNNHFFCCCKGHLCNAKFEWVPKAAIFAKTSTVQPPVQLGKHEPFLVTLYCIVPVVFFVFLVTVIWFVWRKRKAAAFDALPTSDREAGMALGLAGSGGQNYGPQLPQDTPIELLGVIGSGRFGAVWKGKLSGNMVAVKIFPLKEKLSWLAEKNIYNLPQLDGHDNILKFLGVDQRNENLETEFWLATEFHEKGSLYDFLKTNTVSWEELCKIALSIGRGLTFLHEEIPANGKADLKPAVAHRDFKSKNVLIQSDLTACIADFGLALIFEPDKSCGQQHGQVGTRRYMAPEVLEGAINFSRDAFLRIDMYACGLVLWELATRCTAGHITLNNPSCGLNVAGEEYKLPFEAEGAINPSLEQMQEFVVTQKLRPKIKPSWRLHPGMALLCDTIEECWDHDAEARLSASCVVERVRDFQHRSFSNNVAERLNALNVDSGVGSAASTATDDTDHNSSLADDLDINASGHHEMTPLFILNQNGMN